MHVSKHIVLIPPDISYKPGSGDIVIRLLHGASFGTGQHPTTRLSLQAIDWLFSETGFAKNCRQESELLDIGTGSGVLAIAGIKMGITKGFGTDIDPCALSEAKVNARINNLERTLTFGNPDLEIFKDRFSLIIANLRFPTLKELCPRIISLTGTQGAIVLSGIKSDELPKLVKIYSKNNFTCSWQKLEKDWGAAVFLDIDKFLGNC